MFRKVKFGLNQGDIDFYLFVVSNNVVLHFNFHHRLFAIY